MTGAQLLTYVKRRLAENGLTVPAERDAELLDLITEGRDALLVAFALCAPVVVRQTITLETDGANDRLRNFPAATKDPFRVLAVKDASTGEELTPSASLNNDSGQYAWNNIRQLRLNEDVQPEGAVEIDVVLAGVDIVSGTAEAAIGLPTTCHRAIGKMAAVLAMTADEQSDASNAKRLFSSELERLEALYGDYDQSSGQALGPALMAAIGQHYGDTLY
jgi:hypothetical protein